VHDDASSDESVDFIRQHYPQIVLIESRENVGFCVANNRMAARARGEFLLLLNNDAALWPDALVALLAAARALGRPTILSLPQYEWETWEFLDRGSRLDPFLNPVPNRNPHQHDVGLVMGRVCGFPGACGPSWAASRSGLAVLARIYICVAGRGWQAIRCK